MTAREYGQFVEGKVETRAVRIPACHEHNGMYATHVRLRWVCPVCGGQRGEIFNTLSYDGSRRLGVHGWNNPCGHVDYYSAMRAEARTNGLNGAGV